MSKDVSSTAINAAPDSQKNVDASSTKENSMETANDNGSITTQVHEAIVFLLKKNHFFLQ